MTSESLPGIPNPSKTAESWTIVTEVVALLHESNAGIRYSDAQLALAGALQVSAFECATFVNYGFRITCCNTI